jgi:hypothetical protein
MYDPNEQCLAKPCWINKDKNVQSYVVIVSVPMATGMWSSLSGFFFYISIHMIYFIINDLPVSHLIHVLKLYLWVISLTEDKLLPVPYKINGKDKELNFLKIIDIWTLQDILTWHTTLSLKTIEGFQGFSQDFETIYGPLVTFAEHTCIYFF